jgi:hypothetical protein
VHIWGFSENFNSKKASESSKKLQKKAHKKLSKASNHDKNLAIKIPTHSSHPKTPSN